MKKVLLLLAEGFEEIEALGTVDVLRRMNVQVITAGLTARQVIGSHQITVTADTVLAEVDGDQFDAVVLPGGLPGASYLYDDERVIALLKKFAADGKITAAICAAPMVLDKAGLLKEGCFTMYPAQDLYKHLSNGKRPRPESVITHGTVITGKGPGATFEFAGAVALALKTPPELVSGVLSGMFVK
ncbi:MAG: DJ-1/PfpI family protein [Lentisphaerae bacterium]|nr:DJ-1/PfpI family protein [Lentisphaerota bacterium]